MRYKSGRCVVRAGGFSLGSGGEFKGAIADNRMMVEEAFVHRTQFLNVQSRVIDPAIGAGVLIPVVGQIRERLQEVTIGEGPFIEVDRFKQSAIQDRKFEEAGQGLAVVLGRVIPQKVEQDT